MCTHPVYIRSPKYKANTFLFGIDKESLLVPCGHCEECQQKKTDDMTFRLYYEYLSCIADGGFSLVSTFTYSEKFVPNDNGFRYFRRKDISDFLKRLRKYLTMLGYQHEGRLKYCFCSEFGCTTYRPHYHGAFFVHFKIDSHVFYDLVRKAWQRKYLDDIQSIGFVDNRDVEDLLVNSIAGIRYVTKYICKGSSAVDALMHQNPSADLVGYVRCFCKKNEGYDFTHLQPWQLSRIFKYYQYDNPYVKDLQLMPFCALSHGIGLDFLNSVDYLDLLDVVSIRQKSAKGYKDYAIPMYFQRKVFYNYDKNSKRFILNDFGKDYFIAQKHNEVSSLKDFISTFSSVIDDCVKKVSSFDNLHGLVFNYLHGRSLDHFVKYCVYFKDRHIHPVMNMLFDSLDDKNIDDACSTFENLLCESYINDSQQFVFYDDLHRSLFAELEKVHQSSQLMKYDLLPCFDGYNELYSILQRVKILFKKKQSEYLKYRIEKDYQQQLRTSKLNLEKSIIV